MTQARRRGVRASRVALERALAAADLPRQTQAALAERIADLESLDSPPRDLVSRVFREQPVDPQSIERVARSLGVPAHTLYLTSADPSARESVPGEPVAPERARRVLHMRAGLIGAVAGGMLIALIVWLAEHRENGGCRLDDAVVTAPGRLGVLITRLEGDPDDQGQRYLADRFLEDAALSPFVSVISLCETFSERSPGDRMAQKTALRKAAQQALVRRRAHVLIWGERSGDRLGLHLVSLATDPSSRRVEIGGRSMSVDERFLEIPLNLANPDATLPDLKRLALALMALKDPSLAQSRQTAEAQYASSIEWLEASIVTDRQLLDSIEKSLDPTRWALVNGDLCYKLRLLGDFEGVERHHQAAVAACEEALSVRPKASFPQEWAALSTNLGSAWLRLHAFSRSREEALERLAQAQSRIEAAEALIDQQRSPQLWAVNQRTLGTIHIRRGELGGGVNAGDEFARGIEVLEGALAVEAPAFQPLDWALTQQNICLALYQHGARLGKAGIPMVREALTRCQEAVKWLSPELADLSWAMVQNNLAASTAVLAQLEGDPKALAAAEAAFLEAQKVYTRERVPLNWAEVELNLGELNCNLAVLGGDAERLNRAAAHTNSALAVFVEKGAGPYWRYAEQLLAAIQACDRESPAACSCGG